MGTHYLLDLHDSPAGINDVNVPSDGRSLCNGSFVVRVPPGISVKDPVSLTGPVDQEIHGHARLVRRVHTIGL
jgi:hypothetical protein